jgi:phospholipid N-methyltransferase
MATQVHKQKHGQRPRAAGSASCQGALRAYLTEFVKDPLGVGSPIPSFAHTVGRLLDPIDWQRLKVIVEYGPGTGRFTKGALKRMRPDATLIAIDTSPGFTTYLRRALPDARLRAVAASARDVQSVLLDQGFGQCDCILSGLPFSTLSLRDAQAIIEASHRLLRPGGLFVAYQVRDHVRGLLARDFTMVGEAYEWLNLPPYRLYWFMK